MDQEIIKAAVQWAEHLRERANRIEDAIRAYRPVQPERPEKKSRRKPRAFSDEARKRMAEAQRKRWAKFRGEQ